MELTYEDLKLAGGAPKHGSDTRGLELTYEDLKHPREGVAGVDLRVWSLPTRI